MVVKICKNCGKIITNKENKGFCCFECYSNYKHKKMEKRKTRCDCCGKIMIPRNCKDRKNEHHYCSLECMYQYRKTNDLRETKVNDEYFNVLNPKTCWILGMIASDGCVRKNKFLCLSQSGEEGLKCIQYIKNELHFFGKINEYKPKNGKMVYNLTINSPKIVQKLKEYNIVENKTKTYTIPDIILNNKDYLRYFLWGYIDGDGCIGIYDKSLLLEFVCNNDMSKQLLSVLPKTKPLNKKSVIEFRYYNFNAIELGKWLFNIPDGIYQSYKYKKFYYYIENVLDKTRNIKYNILREKVYKLLDDGIECMKIAKIVGLPFQTVYKYRNERNKNDRKI